MSTVCDKLYSAVQLLASLFIRRSLSSQSRKLITADLQFLLMATDPMIVL